MATNPLKILTYLTASKDAAFNENVNITGNLTVNGNATVDGNLTVKGTYTYIQSTVVTVGDLNLNLGTGSNTPSVLDGGGIDLGSSSIAAPAIQWRYDNANTSWTSNVDVNLKTDSESYKISGSDVLTKTGTTLEVGAGVNTVKITAPLEVTGALYLSASTPFSYIATPINGNGLYNVDDAIHALDTAVSGAVTASVSGVQSAYNSLRAVITGTLSAPGPNAGQATIILTTYSATEFATSQIDNIALDILIDANNTGRYTNDLVAMELYTSGSDLKVQIDAPAAASGKYRLIAVNERDGGLG